MRLYILGVCIFLFLFVSIESRRGKDKWRHKKQRHLSKLAKFSGRDYEDGVVDNFNDIRKSFNKPPFPIHSGRFQSKKFDRKMKDKNLKRKKLGKLGKKHRKNLSWVNFKTDADCNMECKPEEVCIAGPVDKKPLCVRKRDLKKSMKLFRRYHKKETKPWRKFQKKSHKKDMKWLKKEDKFERKIDHKIIALKKHYVKKFGNEEGFERYLKKHDFKNSMEEFDFKEPMGESVVKKYRKEKDLKNLKRESDLENEKYLKHYNKNETNLNNYEKGQDFKDSIEEGGYKDYKKGKYFEDKEKKIDSEDSMEKNTLKETSKFHNFDRKETSYKMIENRAFRKSYGKSECSQSEFVQMRTRLMAWYHFLHGQDHLARKAHGGNLSKFYKHESVKKELREHNGMKCSCLKSAMWQFQQLDKSDDNHLSSAELSVLEDNSLEPCMKPYLSSCDLNGDKKLSSDEWCCCFSHIVAPCYRMIEEIKESDEKEDSFVPRCDREGYFMREQCKSKPDAKLFCWCVDVNGNEIEDTATLGRAHCSKRALQDIKGIPFF